MSERPDNPQNQESNYQGGWHSPGKASPWQEPETKSTPSIIWREMKALSDDVPSEPEVKGGWHQPAPEDTIFSPDDVVEVSNEVRDVPVTSPIQAVRPEDPNKLPQIPKILTSLVRAHRQALASSMI